MAHNADERQAVVDAFVEAVHERSAAAVTRRGRQLALAYFEDGEACWTEACDGVLLTSDQVPTDPDDCQIDRDVLEDHVSPERYEEITDGAALTEMEHALWQRLAAVSILTDNPDGDEYASWSVGTFRHSDGRAAFAAFIGGGYSFTEPSFEFLFGTDSMEQALGQLREIGFISPDDFNTRWPGAAPRSGQR